MSNEDKLKSLEERISRLEKQVNELIRKCK